MAAKVKGVSDDDLDSLTDEEREGLEDDEDQDEGGEDEGADEGDKAKAKGGDGAGDDDDDHGEAEDKAARRRAEEDETDAAMAEAERLQNERKAKEDADKKAAANGEGDDGKDDGDDDAVSDGPAIPRWQPPADLKQKQETLKTEKDNLAKAFDEGELSAAEYQAKLNGLYDQERELDRQITKAEVGSEMRIEHYTKVTVPAFMEKYPQYKAEGSVLYRLLDETVAQLQSEKDVTDPFSPKILEKAHQKIIDDLKAAGVAVGTPKDKDEGKDGDKGKKQLRTTKDPSTRQLPPSLAHVPPADRAGEDDNEFSELDRLAESNPERYETALATLEKKNPEAFDRYMRS